ncbi:MAG: hypothetical protein PHI65_07485, partial [Firmicutes bacterium]|nr:hypothetical protein [Bacillota bacterium]
CDDSNTLVEIEDPKAYAKKVLETSNRLEIAALWQPYHLDKLEPKKFDKAHCLKNLETEELLLKEYQQDFPDIDLIAQLERLLD